MKVYIEPIGKLINEFSKLPGVGMKTAQRYAYRVINMTDEEALAFSDAILNAKKNVHYCKICGNFSEGEVCDICKNRSDETICVYGNLSAAAYFAVFWTGSTGFLRNMRKL